MGLGESLHAGLPYVSSTKVNICVVATFGLFSDAGFTEDLVAEAARSQGRVLLAGLETLYGRRETLSPISLNALVRGRPPLATQLLDETFSSQCPQRTTNGVRREAGERF
jgi:hypothetical protein